MHGVMDRLNNNVNFQKPTIFFARRGRCDGQTQQQCFFSENYPFSTWTDSKSRNLYFETPRFDISSGHNFPETVFERHTAHNF